MSYRNKDWYLVMLKNKSAAQAYRFITDNLKAPSFVYEDKNAYSAYEQLYGCKFASPAEMKAIEDRMEIERLKAELEAVKVEKRKEVAQPKIEVDISTSADDIADEFVGLTAEQFKDKWIAENGTDVPLKRGRAWAKYKKENGIVE